MVWPAAIAGGALIGSTALGSVMNKSKRISPHDDMGSYLKGLRKFGAETSLRQMQNTISAAKASGIHPLVAMGMSPSSGGSFTPSGSTVTGSTYGDAVGAVGEAVGRVTDAWRGRRDEQRQAARMSMEAGANSLREQEARIARDSAAAVREMAEARKAMAEARSRSIIAAVERQPGRGAEILTLPNRTGWRTSPTARQQEVEDNYGGIVGEGYGIWRLLNDLTEQPRRPQVPNTPRSRAPNSGSGFYPELY